MRNGKYPSALKLTEVLLWISIFLLVILMHLPVSRIVFRKKWINSLVFTRTSLAPPSS